MKEFIFEVLTILFVSAVGSVSVGVPVARRIVHSRLEPVREWCDEQRPAVQIDGWTNDHRPDFCKGGDTDG